jgi:hypothetical protein
MRTKVLLLSAVLAALGAASAVAQVYSVNAVGYVNVTVDATSRPTGAFAMICNPLDQGTGNYTVAQLIPNPPENTVIFKYNDGVGYDPANIFELGAWGDPAQTIPPGKGVFVKVPGGQTLTITFVGEVPQGPASNKNLIANFNMTGSVVPQAGAITTVLQYPADENDVLYKWDVAGQAYLPVFIFELGAWGPSEPSLAVGEAVFLKPAAARTWNRNFSVN